MLTILANHGNTYIIRKYCGCYWHAISKTCTVPFRIVSSAALFSLCYNTFKWWLLLKESSLYLAYPCSLASLWCHQLYAVWVQHRCPVSHLCSIGAGCTASMPVVLCNTSSTLILHTYAIPFFVSAKSFCTCLIINEAFCMLQFACSRLHGCLAAIVLLQQWWLIATIKIKKSICLGLKNEAINANCWPHFLKPKSSDDILKALDYGNRNRTQHPTDMNASSSRSHAVFQVFKL